ncbi:TB2/DP1, HVA22 family-domain-containing protein [Xylariaceae sp. FL0804]|nr:TB2/DP1, HVA22 family-domain-containing protein [Xylariaceae sp. FL0804]
MFNIVAHFIASIVSFLFPLFASYKALKTSDPAQLTPWLMYWSVLSCAVLVESWTEFILVWVPFYSWIRLGFLTWLVLPSTQGARVLYEAYLHPYLEENELAIEDFIASAHDRLKAAGLQYLKQAIELVRTRLLGMAPSAPPQEEVHAKAAPAGYTQALLARFAVPGARWAANNAGSAGHDFYNILAGAVSAAAASSPASGGAGGSARDAGAPAAPNSRSLIPENLGGAQEKMSFIAAQRERLAFVMGALDKEAAQLARDEPHPAHPARQDRPSSLSLDGAQQQLHAPVGGERTPSRPPSGYSVGSGLSKSRSEVDFEKIDAESGAEEEYDEDGQLRRRGGHSSETTPTPSGGAGAVAGGVLRYLWGGGSGSGGSGGQAQSTGYQSQ